MQKKYIIAAFSLLAACAQAQKPVILIVHGRGQLGRDSAQFRRDAFHALQASLHKADASVSLDEHDVRLVWYADVLDARASGAGVATCPATQVNDSLRTRETMPSALSLIALFAGPIFDAAARDAKGDDANDLRSLAGDLRYLSDLDTRCAAERRVGDALRLAHRQARPVILISHSLGALVTWSELVHAAAMRDTSIGTIDRWITVGSPLGSPEIRQLVFGDEPSELERPANVRTWLNVIGADDPFAVRIGDSARNALSEVATTLSHGNPHHILSYLEDAATARAVLDGFARAGRR